MTQQPNERLIVEILTQELGYAGLPHERAAKRILEAIGNTRVPAVQDEGLADRLESWASQSEEANPPLAYDIRQAIQAMSLYGETTSR